MNCKKGSSQSQTRIIKNFGPNIHILQINVEGLSKDKCDYLSKLAIENSIDVIALQESHLNEDNITKGKVAGFKMIGYLPSSIHGSVMYVRNSLCDIKRVCCQEISGTEVIALELSGLTVVSVYKPPNTQWPTPALPPVPQPCIYLGDFNSHHASWGYTSNDENGEKLVEWAEGEKLYLSYDAKEPKTFRSARWHTDTNPDLCFLSTDKNTLPMSHTRKVLKGFPRSQHRPTIVKTGLEIPIINSTNKPRWNFKKANWDQFKKEVDSNLRWVAPKAENYKRFVGVIIGAAKRNIPRGLRKQYIPCWNDTIENLYAEHQQTGNPDTGKRILEQLSDARKQKWMDLTSNLNFTHSSRKAWGLLRKLGTATNVCKQQLKITPSELALHIKSRAEKVPVDINTKEKVKNELNEINRYLHDNTTLSDAFTERDVNEAIKTLKMRKAAGLDGIFPEFIKHIGEHGRTWLKKFYNDILETGRVPQQFKIAHTLAILKPGKPVDDPSSYRPIALLSVCFKLLERLVYNRIQGIINNVTPTYQAGFRNKRSCCEQVLALTSYIEAGFQKKLKTSVAFVDLSAAYDTVWLDGLLLKLKKHVPSKKLTALVGNMLTNRYFKVSVGQNQSKSFTMKNGLPQGSVLAPLLFNLYTSDMPNTACEKFCYADDLAIAIQTRTLEEGEDILSRDLETLNKYYKAWRLQPNAAKTEVCAFHLNNRIANQQLNVNFCQQKVRHNFQPKYLGITLDRSLTYKRHLENTSQKLKSRNNIVKKLAGTTWGADASTLRTTVLTLVYPVAEYCAPVWQHSTHTRKLDVQLNESMRIITGTLKSTPIPWLHTISNIPPPELRRQEATDREWRKLHHYDYPQDLPIHKVLNDPPPDRLKSRTPLWHNGKSDNKFDIKEEWRKRWNAGAATQQCVQDPTASLPGFHLERSVWTRLNRIRTGHARCNATMHKWGLRDSPACDCGAQEQTVQHIIKDCPQRKYPGPFSDFINATPSAISWLQSLDIEL